MIQNFFDALNALHSIKKKIQFSHTYNKALKKIENKKSSTKRMSHLYYIEKYKDDKTLFIFPENTNISAGSTLFFRLQEHMHICIKRNKIRKIRCIYIHC